MKKADERTTEILRYLDNALVGFSITPRRVLRLPEALGRRTNSINNPA